MQQERFLRLGAVPRLVSVLLQHSENEALLSSCLLALCNLADMGEEDGSLLSWEEGAYFGEGERVFRGTSRYCFGFSTAVTLVRLKQWTNGQYSVAVEVLQRCSTMLWGTKNGHQTGHRLPNFAHLGSCPKLYKVIKCSVKNIPRNRNLRAAVLHTLLWGFIIVLSNIWGGLNKWSGVNHILTFMELISAICIREWIWKQEKTEYYCSWFPITKCTNQEPESQARSQDMLFWGSLSLRCWLYRTWEQVDTELQSASLSELCD